MNKKSESKVILFITALFCSLLWGSAFPIIKLSYQILPESGILYYLSFAGVRFVIAGGVILAFNNKNLIRQFQECPKKLIIGVTLTQVVMQYIFFYWGLSYISGVLAAILIATGSFWWLILDYIFNKNRSLTLKQILLIFLGFIGVIICLYQPEQMKTNHYLGVIFILLAAIGGALASFFIQNKGTETSVKFITGISLLSGGIILILISPQLTISILLNSTMQIYGIILYLAMVSALAFTLWYWLITRYSIVQLSLYRFLVPICGVLESAIFLKNEKITIQIAVGSLIVLSSIYFLENSKNFKMR